MQQDPTFAFGDDYKRLELGKDYRTTSDDALHNWLTWRLRPGEDCDRIALTGELATVSAAGFRASPDTMNSLRTTLSAALRATRRGHKSDAKILAGYSSYADIATLFAPFAELTHTRGNFLLVPVLSRYENFNTRRGGRDYWDLALAGIKGGRFEQYFSGKGIAEQFRIDEMKGGFGEWAERNCLQMYLGPDGEVLPLWPGHLDAGARTLPQTLDDVKAFLDNACTAIQKRTEALARL